MLGSTLPVMPAITIAPDHLQTRIHNPGFSL